MKFLYVLLAAVTVLAAATTNRLHLVWDTAPDYDTNVSFNVYSQTNVALPVNEWKLLTNISFHAYTNAAKPGEPGRVEIPAAADYKQFYVVTASNMTGESDFSDSVYSRRLPRGTGLRIGAH